MKPNRYVFGAAVLLCLLAGTWLFANEKQSIYGGWQMSGAPVAIGNTSLGLDSQGKVWLHNNHTGVVYSVIRQCGDAHPAGCLIPMPVAGVATGGAPIAPATTINAYSGTGNQFGGWQVFSSQVAIDGRATSPAYAYGDAWIYNTQTGAVYRIMHYKDGDTSNTTKLNSLCVDNPIEGVSKASGGCLYPILVRGDTLTEPTALNPYLNGIMP